MTFVINPVYKLIPGLANQGIPPIVFIYRLFGTLRVFYACHLFTIMESEFRV